MMGWVEYMSDGSVRAFGPVKIWEGPMYGTEHMRFLSPDELRASGVIPSPSDRLQALRDQQNAYPLPPDGNDHRWSQGYQRGGVPDIEPIHAPYYSDTLTRAWSVMCGLLWGSFGFVLGAVVVMALR